MAQPSDSRVLYPVEPATIASPAPTPAATPEGSTAGPPDNSAHAPANGRPTGYTEPPLYFHEALDDAERLLKYAAETGVDVDAASRDHILEARAASCTGWNEETVANLLAALTTLSARLRPVSAASLKAYSDDTEPTVRTYWIVAILLAIVIVPFSIASFVSSAISTVIRTDIVTANDLVVKLRAELGTKDAPKGGTPDKPLPPSLSEAEVFSQLQLYASTLRGIDARTRQLNAFVLEAARDPYIDLRWDPKKPAKENVDNASKLKDLFQLPLGVPNMPETLDTLTSTYQDDRLFAQDTLDLVSVYYGAIATCILPVLYALLGTCAYLLRTFEQQMAIRTFMPSVANSARFLIAAIGGAVVGLFNNFNITQGATIPPLAIAFLVGYAVDVFFTFLESLIGAFTKNKSGTPSPQPAPAAGTKA
ncbi:MAG: hypothetical protein ABSG02_11655 [Terriglobales bacterium]